MQINFCKNPTCQNYGVAATETKSKGISKSNAYKSVGIGADIAGISCLLCKETLTVKSNLAVVEEAQRMLGEVTISTAPGCPEKACANHSVPAEGAGLLHYHRFGKTSSGSLRFRCKLCRRLFSISQLATTRQRIADKNELIFKLLVNKSPMRRICKVMEIGPETLYQRVGFFYDQAIAFAASKEALLLEGMPIKRLNIGVDRQDYMVNWTTQTNRRNVILHAVSSADNASGFVFGIHLDFDPAMDTATVEAEAATIGDHKMGYAFRRYARLWLQADYRDVFRASRAVKRKAKPAMSSAGVVGDVAQTYVDLEARTDVEAGATPSLHTRLPDEGMQVHSEYTLYGHFFFLDRLLRGVEKIRFYLDQESGIRHPASGIRHPGSLSFSISASDQSPRSRCVLCTHQQRHDSQ